MRVLDKFQFLDQAFRDVNTGRTFNAENLAIIEGYGLDEGGEVSWAFPLMTTKTSHRVSFSTGEKSFGA